jgi:hypothetical protein
VRPAERGLEGEFPDYVYSGVRPGSGGGGLLEEWRLTGGGRQSFSLVQGDRGWFGVLVIACLVGLFMYY